MRMSVMVFLASLCFACVQTSGLIDDDPGDPPGEPVLVVDEVSLENAEMATLEATLRFGGVSAAVRCSWAVPQLIYECRSSVVHCVFSLHGGGSVQCYVY